MQLITELYISLCFILLYSAMALAEKDVPLVKTKQGLIQGIKDTSFDGHQFYSYLGIPFAEPPLGKLRFKAPVPKSPWKGTLMTKENPPFCLQKGLFDVLAEDISDVESYGEEDCLYLNVHTPQPSNREANLPVMVFIHGGGFMCGGAAEYGPTSLMKDDIILVVIQYRLGIFGFFSTEDSVLPGNMGLKDQQFALKWVQENIKEFGGNPGSITLFGESAGSASVHYQVLSPGSKGLFHRVIMQSGTVLSGWAHSRSHKKFAMDAAKKFGCSLDERTEKFLTCIQNVDAKKLVNFSFSTFEWGLNPFHVLPRVDGEFLPSPPEVILKKKKYNKVDIITGVTQNEGSFILSWIAKNPSLMTKLKTNFDKYGPLSLYLNGYSDSPQMAKKVYQFYLKDKINSMSVEDEGLLDLFSDVFFKTDHDKLISFLASDSDISVYLYSVDHVGEYSLTDLVPEFKRKEWVSHADELAYLFSGGLFSAATLKGDDLKFRSILQSLWINFVIHGTPTPKGSIIEWEKIKGPNEIKQLGLTTTPKMIDYDFDEKRKLWNSLRTKENVLLGIYDDSYDRRKTEL